MRTTSNLPLRELTMRTQEPKGRFGWAAVKLSELKRSPLAVFLPSNSAPYQLALPTQVLIGLGASLKWATRGASITGAIRNIKGTQRRAAHVMKNGRFIARYSVYISFTNGSRRGVLCQPFSARNLPFNSLILDTLASEMSRGSLSTIPSLAVGSEKLAVPTCTAAAPIATYSSASSAVSTPPSPITGILTAFRVSQTRRKVMGFIAGPESPPVRLPSRDWPVRKSMAMAG